MIDDANMPMVSFVVPCFNSASCLEKALLSIIQEREIYYPNLEIIVIDGGSQDNTLEIIQKYTAEISYWISERDNGPADAFNKGIRAARGKYIRFMAADDAILSGKTIELVNYIERHPEVSIVAGQFERINHHDEPEGSIVYPGLTEERRIHFLDLAFWGTSPEPTPECCLFRIESLRAVGLWDIKYRYASDLAFWFKAVKLKQVIVMLPVIVIRRFENPNSLTSRYQAQVEEQTRYLLKNEAGVLFSYFRTVRFSPIARRIAEAPFRWLGLHPIRAWKSVKKRMRAMRWQRGDDI
jgi:glycosyltransferase involved in cell wall biosynthesis